MRFLPLCLVVSLIACTGTEVRPVAGRLSSALRADHIVVAETASGVRSVAAPSADGLFLIPVRVNTPTRLFLATKTPQGTFQRGLGIGPMWFTLRPGQTVDLGEIREAGTTPSTGSTSGATHLCPEANDDGDDDHDGEADAGHGGPKDHGHDGDRADAGSHDGDDHHADGGSHDDGDHHDDGECKEVEVEGCEHHHAECDHDDDLPATSGPAETCSAGDGGVPTVDAGPGPVDDGGIR
jgi:hypothetical protein